jgi:hypothetical protein
MSLFSGPLSIEVEGEVYLTPLSPSFGLVDRSFITRVFRERSRTLAGKLSQAIHDLQNGSFGQQAFVRQTMRALQQAYYSVFSLGALSVDQFHVLTIEDIKVLDSELFGERKFLRSFARDLSRGTLDLAPEFRARLYFSALRGVFELGRTSALPSGPYDWILGDADHCEPCIQASLGGPYKKDSLSLLSLPVVPGIPGSGDVCSGLTRCGCTLRLKGYPVNETLQLQLRDTLEAIRLEI